MNRSMPGLPVHHQLSEFTETHVHRVSDAIQPSHPLSSPSPLAPNPSQHQSLFQWVNLLYIYIYPLVFGFPSHSGHQRALSSLCYTVGSHYSSSLYVVSIVYICQSQPPNSSHSLLSSSEALLFWFVYFEDLLQFDETTFKKLHTGVNFVVFLSENSQTRVCKFFNALYLVTTA